MEVLLVKGPAHIRGEVSISGSKNAAMAIICGALLAETPVILENVPMISDVNVQLQIAEFLGARIQWLKRNTVRIDSSGLKPLSPPYGLCIKNRASYYLMGVLLSRFRHGRVPIPGGCDLGPRPIDQHLKGFTILGADIAINQGLVEMHGEGMKGNQVYLDMVSVGATINIMLAAVLLTGRTIINNCAKEPEIVDLANFLNAMGAMVRGAGTEIIRIDGVKKLHGINYSIIPDRIEAGTYMLIAAATRGQVHIKNVITSHLGTIITKLREAGVQIRTEEDSIYVDGSCDLKAVNVNTYPYPGFPTDLQSSAAVLLTQSIGTGEITENVFVGRFRYLYELERLGARIKVTDRIAKISGGFPLTASFMQATDIRAGASCIIAGLVAKGITEINGVHHIDRGYEDMELKLRHLGADIVRVDDTTRQCLQWNRESLVQSHTGS